MSKWTSISRMTSRSSWALALCLYQYLDSVRHRLERLEHRYVSSGEDRAWDIQRNEHLQLDWICSQAARGVKPTDQPCRWPSPIVKNIKLLHQ